MPEATVNGIHINYKVDGVGEPLVMVSGLGSDLNAWAFQVSSFRKHYRVIRFDNRGVGKSDTPSGPYSIRMMADDAISLMDHLGVGKAHVLGVSMGGMIAQEIAISYPDRISKLVLGCTFACKSEESGHTEGYARIMGYPAARLRNELTSLTFNKPFSRCILGSLMRLTEKKGWEVGFEAQRAALRNHDTFDRLDRIKAPTLILVGTKDRVIRPGSSNALAAKMPSAKLVRIENGSHAISVETRRKFNQEVLSFLQGGPVETAVEIAE